jgi:hypothetical protein
MAVFYYLSSADAFDQSYDSKIISHIHARNWKEWAVARHAGVIFCEVIFFLSFLRYNLYYNSVVIY